MTSDKAISSRLTEGKVEEKAPEEKPPSLFFLLQYNKPEWPYQILGACASLLAGSMMPVFAFAMAQMMGAFNVETFDTLRDQKDDAEQWILVLSFAGLGILFILFAQSTAYTILGSRLTFRIR